MILGRKSIGREATGRRLSRHPLPFLALKSKRRQLHIRTVRHTLSSSVQRQKFRLSATPASQSPGIPLSKEQSNERLAKIMGAACLSLATVGLLLSGSAGSRFACMAAQKGINSMPAWTGLSAGFLHSLAGPDHLAGLTPLTLGQKTQFAVSMGALWGFGHSSGQLLLGLIFLLLKERFQGIVPLLSKWAGVIVGLTLIAIGIVGFYESRAEHHEDHDLNLPTREKDGSLAKRSLGTYAVGFVYGLHPDALFVVLPALALPTRLATVSYVAMFVVGTVCAMAGYTFAIGTASAAAKKSSPWLLRNLSSLAATIAILIGVLVLLPSLGCKLPFGL